MINTEIEIAIAIDMLTITIIDQSRPVSDNFNQVMLRCIVVRIMMRVSISMTVMARTEMTDEIAMEDMGMARREMIDEIDLTESAVEAETEIETDTITEDEVTMI